MHKMNDKQRTFLIGQYSDWIQNFLIGNSDSYFVVYRGLIDYSVLAYYS